VSNLRMSALSVQTDEFCSGSVEGSRNARKVGRVIEGQLRARTRHARHAKDINFKIKTSGL
jgi:hypothetical protein